jgi:hypothetical protein
VTESCKHTGAFHAEKGRITCLSCEETWPLSRWMIHLITEPDTYTLDDTEGLTVEALAMHTARLDYALREMGRAFWGKDHTPKQERAIEQAAEVVAAYGHLRPQLQPLLEAVIAAFPKAEAI